MKEIAKALEMSPMGTLCFREQGYVNRLMATTVIFLYAFDQRVFEKPCVACGTLGCFWVDTNETKSMRALSCLPTAPVPKATVHSLWVSFASKSYILKDSIRLCLRNCRKRLDVWWAESFESCDVKPFAALTTPPSL